ncbi:hypothetical protein V2I01_16970 [Micromonospora sp. BRA006-A]|nr:hypothetical protein [Micromonospora sp. BRA006-A]
MTLAIVLAAEPAAGHSPNPADLPGNHSPSAWPRSGAGPGRTTCASPPTLPSWPTWWPARPARCW